MFKIGKIQEKKKQNRICQLNLWKTCFLLLKYTLFKLHDPAVKKDTNTIKFQK